MTIRTPKAKQLATKPEFKLYDSSLRGRVGEYSASELRKLVTRSRKARDKYAQLAKRQRREARGKADPRGTRRSQGNARTVEKVQLFQETMDRFEKRLAVVAAKEATKPVGKKATPPGKKKKAATTKKPVRKKKAVAKKKTAKRKTKPKVKTSRKTNTVAKRQRVVRAGVKRSQKHVSSRGRRSQAKRDSRR